LQKAWNYFTYVIVFLITDILLNSKYLYIVYLQILVTYVSCVYLFLLSRKIFNLKTAYLCFFFYLVYIDLHRWNFILYADSLFVSLIIISIYYLINIKNFKQFIYITPLLLMTIGCRPHGILLIFPIILTFIFLYSKNFKKIIFYLFISGIIFFIFFFNSINTILLEYNEWLKYFVNGQYIAEYNSNLSINISDKCLNNNFIYIILCGLYEYPINLLKVNLLKTFYFFFNIRPYWNYLHIIINLIINSFLIFCFIYYLYKLIEINKNNTIIFSFIILYVLSILLTLNDYDGRFFNPIYPFICLYASNAFIIFFRNLKL